jgi:hypothetical protein
MVLKAKDQQKNINFRTQKYWKNETSATILVIFLNKYHRSGKCQILQFLNI